METKDSSIAHCEAKKIAVVTGASSGMGREFALQLCARRFDFDEIWLIARRQYKLAQLASELKKMMFHMPSKILPFDLTDSESIDKYKKMLSAGKYEITVLVNASGFGKFGLSSELPDSVQMSMIDLNVKALTAMCAASIPYMRSGAVIFNMGSLSSFQPVPYLNVYAATKAYVLRYSRGLNIELGPRGIHVIAVSPGWVNTEFFDRAEMTDKTAIPNITPLWRAKDVVRLAIKDARRGRDISILGASIKAQVLLVKLLPHSLVMRLWMIKQGHVRELAAR
ncbi:MAG: SDR family NAD(P)-dependent oxidoreductase [Clostridiales bacterium]|jgi:short-subunit dehydrogenase|nr:SDR family NAD(P)-dependent oxidoreductase [Clostridiales bacterium]